MNGPCLPRPSRVAIIGASGGIGGALAAALASEHVVSLYARNPCSTAPTGDPVPSPLDLTDENSIATAAGTLAPDPPLRMVLVATGLLHDCRQGPEKSLRALDGSNLARSFAVNTIGPALVAKHFLPLMPRTGRSIFAVLSARVGSISDNRLGGWYGYRASKAALNQIVRTLAIEARRTRPELVVAALHPGTVATGLSEPFRGHVEPDRLFTPDEAAGHLLRTIAQLRPAQSGGFFAWDGQAIPF